jgi:hypothetical protein
MAMIDESTFEGCRSLKYVEMPTKLSKIGRSAFKNCTSLSSIILPVGTKSIGFDAFAGCTSLMRIAIPRGVTELEDEDVFSGCDSLREISFGGDEDMWKLLTHGRAIVVEDSKQRPFTPTVTFMNIKE